MLLTTENTSQISAVLGSSNLALGCNRHLSVRSSNGPGGHLKNLTRTRKGQHVFYNIRPIETLLLEALSFHQRNLSNIHFLKKVVGDLICGESLQATQGSKEALTASLFPE